MTDNQTADCLTRRKQVLLAEIESIQGETYDDGTPGEIDGAMIAVRRTEIDNIEQTLRGTEGNG